MKKFTKFAALVVFCFVVCLPLGCSRTVFSRGPWGFGQLNQRMDEVCFLISNPTGEFLQVFLADPVTGEISPRFGRVEMPDDEGRTICMTLPEGNGMVLFEIARLQVSYQKPYERLYQLRYSAANRKTCVPVFIRLQGQKEHQWQCPNNIVILLPIDIYGKSQHGVAYLLQEAVGVKGFYLQAIEKRATQIFLNVLERFGVNIPQLPPNFFQTGMTLPAFQASDFKNGIATIPDDFIHQLTAPPPASTKSTSTPPADTASSTPPQPGPLPDADPQQLENTMAANLACCARNPGTCGESTVQTIRDYLVTHGQTAVKDIPVQTVPDDQATGPCGQQPANPPTEETPEDTASPPEDEAPAEELPSD